MHKYIILATSDKKEMAEVHPVEIGTRGTVGFLLMQQIEYFSQLELNSQHRSQKNKSKTIGMDSSVSADSRPKIVLSRKYKEKARQ